MRLILLIAVFAAASINIPGCETEIEVTQKIADDSKSRPVVTVYDNGGYEWDF